MGSRRFLRGILAIPRPRIPGGYSKVFHGYSTVSKGHTSSKSIHNNNNSLWYSICCQFIFCISNLLIIGIGIPQSIPKHSEVFYIPKYSKAESRKYSNTFEKICRRIRMHEYLPQETRVIPSHFLRENASNTHELFRLLVARGIPANTREYVPNLIKVCARPNLM